MNTLENLISICEKFKQGGYDLEEFESRLESLMITDEFSSVLEKVRDDAVNRLEEIRFCSIESNFYKYGVEVAEMLLENAKDISK